GVHAPHRRDRPRLPARLPVRGGRAAPGRDAGAGRRYRRGAGGEIPLRPGVPADGAQAGRHRPQLVTGRAMASVEFPSQAPALPIDARVDDLVGRMTVAEKATQMLHEAPAIERLGVPPYNWWCEGLHGVARAGVATVFPQAIGLAAMWNAERL